MTRTCARSVSLLLTSPTSLWLLRTLWNTPRATRRRLNPTPMVDAMEGRLKMLAGRHMRALQCIDDVAMHCADGAICDIDETKCSRSVTPLCSSCVVTLMQKILPA